MQKIYTSLSAAILIVLLMLSSGISPSTAQTGTEEAATLAASATPTAITVAQYGLFEAQLPVETIVKNVFDPTQLQVNVVFTAPDGKSVTIPAFWMQPYRQTCSQNCTVEVLQSDGAGSWRVRFTP